MIHFSSSKILIPVDFSETSLLAIKHGAYMAKHCGAQLSLLHVVNTHYMSQNMFLPTVNLDLGEIEGKAAEKLAQLAKDIKSEYGVDADTIIKSGTPSNEVTKVAKEVDASLIVMGTHGYGPLENFVIGSVALKVLTKSHCPTMAMSSDAEHNGYRKIVMPIDDTVNSRQKVNYTLEFAKKFGAEVHAVALLTSNEASDRPALELVLHQIQLLAEDKGVKYHSELLSNVKNRATATINYVEKSSADLLVIMTDQDAELSGFFLGPYSQQVIHLSKVPVIAIKPQDIFINDSNIISGTSGGYQA
jgi:nucleotide-binding universal stress UspA family protein